MPHLTYVSYLRAPICEKNLERKGANVLTMLFGMQGRKYRRLRMRLLCELIVSCGFGILFLQSYTKTDSSLMFTFLSNPFHKSFSDRKIHMTVDYYDRMDRKKRVHIHKAPGLARSK